MSLRILFILLLCTASLHAEVKGKVLLYKTIDKTLNLENIKEKKNLFVALSEDETFDDKNTIYWIQIQVDKALKTRDYIFAYGNVHFYLYSISKEQMFYKSSLGGSKVLRVFYDKNRDKETYYFRLIPSSLAMIDNYIMSYSIDEFYTEMTSYFYYLLIAGLIMGLILMTALYHGAVYFYNKEKSFLYYMLMQFFGFCSLIYLSGLVSYATEVDLIQFNMLNLMNLFFSILFIRYFFMTVRYLPKWDKLLSLYLMGVILDMLYLLFVGESLISTFKLYTLFGLPYLWIAYLRYKNGFKPAKFFLIGWSLFLLSIFVTEYFQEYVGFHLFLLGSTIEAILLAVALAFSIKLLKDEKEQQKNLMIHQSKLASMGEMIANIAHQWRQPLTYLSYSFMTLKELEKQNLLEKKYLENKLDEASKQLEFMSQTIDDFKDFYSSNKEKDFFSLATATTEALELIENIFKSNNIELKLEIEDDISIENYKNEYKQVLLNLISNAKDALVQRKIDSACIVISISKQGVTILDNAGGIDVKPISCIFEPNFSTKEGNFGVGLHMSKLIIEKNMGGVLTVENSADGALFTILF
jgi:signal transduction histidine kinase